MWRHRMIVFVRMGVRVSTCSYLARFQGHRRERFKRKRAGGQDFIIESGEIE